MKKLRNYLLSAVVMLLFTCTFMGIKAEAAAPAQVTGLKQTDAYTSSIDLEWNALLGNDIRYEVYISTDKVNWVNKGYTSYNDCYVSGLNAGTTYYVKVRAYTHVYDSTTYKYVDTFGVYSSILECVTVPSAKPTDLKKTSSTTTSITLKWGKAAGANAYIVEYWPTGTSSDNAKTTVTTKNSIKLSKLKKNTEYNVYIYAIRRTSDKKFSTKASSYLYESGLAVTPGKVTDVTVFDYDEKKGQITVKYAYNDCADGYTAEVWSAHNSSTKKDAKIKGANSKTEYSSYIDLKKSTLKKNRFFKVRVRAYSLTSSGAKKYGAWSSWVYVCPEPEVDLESTSSGMKVSWDKVSGAERYVVYASTKQKSGYKKVATTKKTSYTVKKIGKTALKDGKRYYFYVVPQNKVGKKYYNSDYTPWCWSTVYRK